MGGSSDHDQPRDRARRRLLRMGVYAPAAMVSLSAVSRSAERAQPTTSVGVIVSTSQSAMTKPVLNAKSKVGTGG